MPAFRLFSIAPLDSFILSSTGKWNRCHHIFFRNKILAKDQEVVIPDFMKDVSPFSSQDASFYTREDTDELLNELETMDRTRDIKRYWEFIKTSSYRIYIQETDNAMTFQSMSITNSIAEMSQDELSAISDKSIEQILGQDGWFTFNRFGTTASQWKRIFFENYKYKITTTFSPLPLSCTMYQIIKYLDSENIILQRCKLRDLKFDSTFMKDFDEDSDNEYYTDHESDSRS